MIACTYVCNHICNHTCKFTQKKQYRVYISPTSFSVCCLLPFPNRFNQVHISRLLALPTKVLTWNNAASHERSVSNFEDPTVGGSRPNASRGESHVADVDVVSTFFFGWGGSNTVKIG